MKISYDLKMKIISNYKGVNIEQHYNEIDVGDSTTRIPSYREIELSLDLSNDLDHIVSIFKGFNESIDPKIIGHWKNLRIIKSSKNRSKGKSSSIKISELINKIKEV